MDWNIRIAVSADIQRITEIYNQGIEDRFATFETRLRNTVEMEEWLLNREPRYSVLVIADEQDYVQGWASVNSYNSRCCYGGVGDLSIYIDREMRGKGLGKLLLGGLMDSAREQGFHKLILNAFDSNEAAKKLYLALGFRHVGTYEKQGVMDGSYVDVTIMEKLLTGN